MATEAIPIRKLAPSTLKQQMLRQLVCSDAPEQALRYRGVNMIAGVDEVGRGALFGPVVAAAVILPARTMSLAKAGLTDSKQLLRKDRERLDRRIRGMALAVSVAAVDAATIDRVNIYQATRIAMLTAVNGLAIAPDHLLIDAMRLDHPVPADQAYLWRFAFAFDRGRVGGGEGLSRRHDARPRRGSSAVRPRRAQRLCDAGASPGATGTRPVRAASAQLCAGAGGRSRGVA